MRQNLRKIAILALAAGFAQAASAASIVPVQGVTASGTFGTYSTDDLINGSGLSGDFHSGIFDDKWMSNGLTDVTLTFDLGAVTDVTGTRIWNYGGGCCGSTRSARDITVSFSLDGNSFGSGSNFTLLENNLDPIPVEDIAVSGTGRYVRFALLNNYGDDSFIGLSEVQFYGTPAATAVPEPASWALLILGFGATGAIARRKRRNAALRTA